MFGTIITTRRILENPPLLNQQCTHKCVGNHCPLVGGRVCTAQTFFSCSLGILNIRTIETAGMHNFDQSFKSSGISSPSDLVLFPDHHLLISFATSVLAEFGRGNRTTARCLRARVCADVRMCARARACGSACVTICRPCPTGG